MAKKKKKKEKWRGKTEEETGGTANKLDVATITNWIRPVPGE